MVEYGSGLKLSLVVDDGLNEILRNMRSLGQIIAYESALAVSSGVISLMTLAQPRVPIDTGQLRESGTATLSMGGRPEIIARGSSSGTVNADLSKIIPSRFKKLKAGGYKSIEAEISYYRMSSRGRSDSRWPSGTFDVAVHAHEGLMPADGAIDRAREPGTQGKYLESAFNEHRSHIIAMIRAAVKNPQKIKKYITLKKTTGKFTVDRADINFR